MHQSRTTDPTAISADQVQADLDAGKHPIIQFSKPVHDRALLRQVNNLCLTFGNRLTVRFYDHLRIGFDASVVIDLPDVQNLCVDCLYDRMRNEDSLHDLKSLRSLVIDVEHLNRPDFLFGFDLTGLESLIVCDVTGSRSLDLAPLAAARQLTEVRIAGTTKNISAISSLPKLAVLALSSMPKSQSLTFVNAVPSLKELSLLLGGRASIDEIAHTGLKMLSICRVQGLETLGSLRRFPALRSLKIEEQPRLARVSLGSDSLREAFLLECKNLAHIDDLEAARRLIHLRVYGTQVNLDELVDFAWPLTMKVLALYTGRVRQDEVLRARLDQRGYTEFGDTTEV